VVYIYLAIIKIRRKSVAIAIVIITIVSLLSIYGILYIITPYSGFARSIIWQDSDIKDYERFPFRTIDNAPPVFYFITQDINSTTKESKINGSSLSSPVLFNKIVPYDDTEGKKKSFDEFLASTGTTAFVVIKNDEILYEKYFNEYHEESINTSFSIAKSIVSALIGIAIDEGMIQSIDDPIVKYLPELRQKD
jgi:hypothetical protein